jgi:hypothetical protein
MGLASALVHPTRPTPLAGIAAFRLCEPFFLLTHDFVDFLDVFDILLMVPFALNEHRKQIHAGALGWSHGSADSNSKDSSNAVLGPTK